MGSCARTAFSSAKERLWERVSAGERRRNAASTSCEALPPPGPSSSAARHGACAGGLSVRPGCHGELRGRWTPRAVHAARRLAPLALSVHLHRACPAVCAPTSTATAWHIKRSLRSPRKASAPEKRASSAPARKLLGYCSIWPKRLPPRRAPAAHRPLRDPSPWIPETRSPETRSPGMSNPGALKRCVAARPGSRRAGAQRPVIRRARLAPNKLACASLASGRRSATAEPRGLVFEKRGHASSITRA